MIKATNIELKQEQNMYVLQIEAGQDIFQMDIVVPEDLLDHLVESITKTRSTDHENRGSNSAEDRGISSP